MPDPPPPPLDSALADEIHFINSESTVLFSILSQIFKEAQALSARTYHGFKGQIARLPGLESQIASLRHQAIKLNVKIPDEHRAERINVSKFQADVEGLISGITSKFYGFQPPQTTPTADVSLKSDPATRPTRYSDYVRLPKHELPKFSGNLSDWSKFYGMFTVSIHNNPDIPPTQKFSYLLSALEGEALSTIKTLEPTDANYPIAFELLVTRYKSEKRHKYYHFAGLLSLPEIKHSSHIPPFLTKVLEHTNALTALKVPSESYGALLVTVLTQKLTPYWQRQLDDSRDDPKTYPTLAEFLKFLHNESSQALDNPSASVASHSGTQKAPSSQKSPKVLLSQGNSPQSSSKGEHQGNASHGSSSHHSNAHASSSSSRSNASSRRRAQSPDKSVRFAKQGQDHQCALCEGGHRTFRCPKYLGLNTPAKRLATVREHKLCENCLGNHETHQCQSAINCKHCTRRHHSGLCESSEHNFGEKVSQRDDATSPAGKTFITRAPAKTVVLPTARVLLTANGHSIIVRALLDICADVSIMTTHCAQLLHLRIPRSSAAVSGLSEADIKVNGAVNVDVCTLQQRLISAQHRVLIAKKITGQTPSVVISSSIRSRCRTLHLADPDFDLPRRADLLLGSDILPLVLTGEIINLGSPSPVAMSTAFGYAIFGSAPRQSAMEGSSDSGRVLLTREDSLLSERLERLWTLEEFAPVTRKDPEEEYVEDFYAATTTQGEDGRYCVRLPFRPNHPPLGTSLARAEARLKSLERRFEKEPTFHSAYKKFMLDYEQKGFMSPVPTPPASTQHMFLPHHGVLKESSSTTKLRVVFDASAPTSTKVSLNSVLLPGPKLQTDVRDLIINFRKHTVTLTADIQQMYLYVNVHPEDVKYQMILWRHHPSTPIQAYTLNTVTFGVNCSPFLAIRTIQQLTKDHGHRYPQAAQALLKDVYVDNLLTGTATPEQAKQLKKDIDALAALGGFRFRKWTSSHPEVLTGVPVEDLECPFLDDLDNPRYSILGLQWVAAKDHFTYLVQPSTTANTKRTVLSIVASIYDPLSWLAPVLLAAKAFIQELWRLQLDWDKPLPQHVQDRWDRFVAGFPALKEVIVPRLIHRPAPSYQVHGFCDASQIGYSAVLYLRSAPRQSSETAHVALVIARTRVAPKKEQTIPRLELCAAVLLAQLFEAYLPLLQEFNPEKLFCWSDSEIVLSWIYAQTVRFETFVANRVGKIQDVQAPLSWKYVPSEDNPADCASRGLAPADLPAHPLWWHGPPWLALPESSWPPQPALIPEDALPGVTPLATALLAKSVPQHPDVPLFSTWSKTLRVLGYAHRFFVATHLRTRRSGPLQPEEIAAAELWLIRVTQQFYFAEDIKLIRAQKLASHRLRHLHPYLDDKGILRVGGRLRHADLDADARNPVVIPGEAHIARLLAIAYHRENLHAGPQLLQALLSRKYWILNARKLCRHVVHQCLPCFKSKPRQFNPLMGDLPPARVQPNPPFTKTGMDYAGPIKVKVHQLRSARVVSVYLCIFVCLTVKAIHIEVVHDLTTIAFIAALHRFAARRGCPSDLHSDCGTQFVGASNALRQLLEPDDPQILEFAQQNGIRFHFNPPAAPHQGGIWEGAVKSAKYHLTRTAGTSTLILEEFQTLCCRIEGLLNSRPLTPMWEPRMGSEL